MAEGDKIGKNIFELAEFVEQQLEGYEVRVSVLGHMQRGGNPSCYDRVLASRMGVGAVDALMAGKSMVMIGIQNNKIVAVPLIKAVKNKQKIDPELIRVSDIVSL